MKRRGKGERRGRVYVFDAHAVCISSVPLVGAFTACNILGSHSATCEIIDPSLRSYISGIKDSRSGECSLSNSVKHTTTAIFYEPLPLRNRTWHNHYPILITNPIHP